MPNFAANLSMLFKEVPFMQRFALARAKGFSAVEYLFPYDYSITELRGQLAGNGLKQVLFNMPAGDWAAGERGIAANPDRMDDFRSGVAVAIEYAEGLGVTQLNCLAGTKLPQYTEKDQMDVLVENLHYAGEVFRRSDLKLLIEPINHFDIPGFLLNKVEQVLRLIDAVAMPNVFIQYDIYHAQRETGELTAILRDNINKISHIQIADNPGRHEPGTGEINYPFLFREIDSLRYQGYIGLEYIPKVDSQSAFDWISEFGYSL